MLTIREATTTDIERLITLETRLFVEDAGQHEPFADTTWPEREGRADFEQLIDSSERLLLAACVGNDIVGFLAGYLSPSSPTREPVTYATLRSLYVDVAHRRGGAASALTTHFVDWATERGAAEAHVDSYAANDGAQQLYERHGFAVRSLARVLPLQTP